VIVLDRMLVGSIKFVLGKIASAVEAELNDDTTLREELLAAQMKVELGEMSEEQFAQFEADILARLREIQERKRAGAPPTVGEAMASGDFKVTGIEAEFLGDDEGQKK
jgi:hypothetical protein